MRLPRLARWCLGLVLALAIGVILLLIIVVALDIAAALAPWPGRRPGPVPTAQPDPAAIAFDRAEIDDGGLAMASLFTGPIHDAASLGELRKAVGLRGRLGLAVMQAVSDHAQLGIRSPRDPIAGPARLVYQVGLLNIYEGRFPDAATCFRKSLSLGRPRDISAQDRAERTALLGIVELRQAVLDNELAHPHPQSGILPLAPGAVHEEQAHTRAAVQCFTSYLEEWPGDLRVRWLLNLAYLALGEHPEKVPGNYLIPLERFRSERTLSPFENTALRSGLAAHGPNMAGGNAFDDFTGDGLPDLFVASLDADSGARLFVNRGDGTFQDRSDEAGLADQVAARNVAHADFDNDGDLDVVIVRGGWEMPMRLSLLENKGDGSFVDVTLARGLGEPIAAASAAWGDSDNDGWADLFVCGEYVPASGAPGKSTRDPRNRCRLYRNLGNGTFRDCANAALVLNERSAQGVAWGDYDDDGRLDIYVSNRNAASRLFHNEGNGTFCDVAPALGITGPDVASACWFWDFDNDSRLDIFVCENQTSLADTVAFALGMPFEPAGRPRLFRNLGAGGFRELGREAGLGRPMAALSANFGDFDSDGYLDIYVGTGWRSFSGLVPNLLFKNVDGSHFEDVTFSSGTGSLQKGNSVSFADYDADGSLDLFVQTGGAVPGDKSHNLLFRNPGQNRHWLKVKLNGTRTNRAAIGARLRVDLESAGGRLRSIYRTVGSGSSFGGSSLVESIGLGAAARAAALSVTWPVSRTTQKFFDVAADQTIEITE
jgi:hypothetical protein